MGELNASTAITLVGEKKGCCRAQFSNGQNFSTSAFSTLKTIIAVALLGGLLLA